MIFSNSIACCRELMLSNKKKKGRREGMAQICLIHKNKYGKGPNCSVQIPKKSGMVRL